MNSFLMKYAAYVALVILLSSYIYWSKNTFWLCRDVRYNGDAIRYNDATSRLVEAWENIGIFDKTTQDIKPLSLLIPISPSGEKPFFIYSSSLVRFLLKLFHSKYQESSILILNQLSVALLSIGAFFIIKERNNKVASVLGALVILLNYDIFYHAREGFHTVFGAAFLFLGYSAAKDLKSRWKLAASGICFGAGVFASPSVLVPAIIFTGIYVLELIKTNEMKKLVSLIAGIGSWIIIAQISLTLRKSIHMPVINPIKQLLWEGSMATTYGKNVPLDVLFGVEYFLFIFGGLLGGLLVFLILFDFLRQKKDLFNRALLLSLFGLFCANLILRIPTTGRNYSIWVCLLSILAVKSINSIKSNYRKLILTIILIVLATTRFYTHLSAENIFNYKINHFDDEIFKSGQKIIELDASNSLSKIIHKSGRNLIKVDATKNFTHSEINNANDLSDIHCLMQKGLAPILVKPKSGLIIHNYLNEYGYSAFYKNRWKKVFPEYKFLEKIMPGFVYYFCLDDIIELNKKENLVGKSNILNRNIYRSPKYPDSFYLK